MNFGDLLNSFGNTAANIIGSVNGNRPASPSPVANNPSAAAATGKMPAWLTPVLYIGGGLLALVLVFKLIKD